MSRFASAFAVLILLAALPACESRKPVSPASPTTNVRATPAPTASVSRTPSERPAGVPGTARAVDHTTRLGQIARRAEQTPETANLRRLLDAFCLDGLMTIQTSQEAIYAALPCDRFWDDQAKRQFVNKEAAVVLEVTRERFRVLLETLDGAQGEFTVDGIWVR